MAKNKNRRRRHAAHVELLLGVLTVEMREHVVALGLESVDAYLRWCRSHGFAQRLLKNRTERQCERMCALRAGVVEQLLSTERIRNPAHIVRCMLRGVAISVCGPYRSIALALAGKLDEPSRADGYRELLAELLEQVVRTAPELLEPESDGLPVMLRMAEQWPLAVRRPELWKPTSHNQRRCLASLVRHVFARYEVAPCLEGSWFVDDDDAKRHRGWYLHVAQGYNLRTADLPIPYTKRMAHWFATVPGDYSVHEALRYGQVVGLGGDAALARACCGTLLGRTFEHDDFWLTVIQFCIRHRIREIGEVTAIVDFVNEHRFAQQTYIDERGRERRLPPLQPQLSMRGRSPTALRRQIEAWHGRLGRGSARDERRWPASGIAGYRGFERDDGEAGGSSVWMVRELCSAAELRREGGAMSNCVASYVGSCVRGETRIFSMTMQRGDRVQHVLTIEVRSGAVVQALGRANSPPSIKARQVMRRWAAGVGLQARSWV